MEKKTPEQLVEITQDVTKQLLKCEMYHLYDTVFDLPDGSVIVEIGSYCGGSTVIMGTAIRDSGKTNTRIYAIDPFLGSSDHGNNVDTYQEYLRAIRGHEVEQYITTLRATSEQACAGWEFGKRIDFLWIDGAHDYEFVAKDIQLWTPLMNLEAKVALHDSGGEFFFGDFSGVRRAIREFMFAHQNFKDYGFVGSITHAVRTNRMTSVDWAKTRRAYLCWWIGKNELYTRPNTYLTLPLKVAGRYVRRAVRMVRHFWAV